MIIGRVTKDPAEVRRWVADFRSWLDDGEIVESISEPEIELLPAAWAGPWPASPRPPEVATLPDDPTPITVVSYEVTEDGSYTQVFYEGGTDGNRYKLSLLATGSSGRSKLIELEVQATTSSAELLG